MTDPTPILRVKDLRVTHARRDSRPAVDGVSFDLLPGRTLGIVGGSGCGKSTLARAILGLIPADEGTVEFDGHVVLPAKGRTMLRRLRRGVQMVFQDPGSSLDPTIPILRTVREPLDIHGVGPGRQRDLAAADALLRCGLPHEFHARLPRMLSGGQRQRAAIARALVLSPKVVICDEPTSALDVSVQAQVLNLLKDLGRDLGLSLVFISHDLPVVWHMCDDVAVMHQGRFVEIGPADVIIRNPRSEEGRALAGAF